MIDLSLPRADAASVEGRHYAHPVGVVPDDRGLHVKRALAHQLINIVAR